MKIAPWLIEFYMSFSPTVPHSCRQVAVKSKILYNKGLSTRAATWGKAGLLRVCECTWDAESRHDVRTYQRTGGMERFVRVLQDHEESGAQARREKQAAYRRDLRAAWRIGQGLEMEDPLPEIRRTIRAERHHWEDYARACRRIGSLGAMCGQPS